MVNSKHGFTILRVLKENYHLFDDLVYYRMNGKERTTAEKEVSKDGDYSIAYRELDYENFYVYAACLDDKFVAWISIIYIPKIGKGIGGIIYVDELYTRPDYRNRGIAYELLQKVKEHYEQRKAYLIRLYVGDDNRSAQHVYQKIGLEDKGVCRCMESRIR